MAGLQKYQFTQDQNIKIVNESMKSNNKILFLQKALTGSSECYQNNVQVSMIPSLRNFRTIFDSKRVIISSSASLLDTIPFKNIDQAFITRSLMNLIKNGNFSENYTPKSTFKTSSSCIQDTIKILLRLFNSLKLSFYDLQALFAAIIYSLKRAKFKTISINTLNKWYTEIEFQPGIPTSLMVPFQNNIKLIYILYEELLTSYIHPSLLIAFREYFSNFYLPVTALITQPEKSLLNINNVDPIILSTSKTITKQIIESNTVIVNGLEMIETKTTTITTTIVSNFTKPRIPIVPPRPAFKSPTLIVTEENSIDKIIRNIHSIYNKSLK